MRLRERMWIKGENGIHASMQTLSVFLKVACGSTMPHGGIALPLPAMSFRNEAVATPPFASSNAELIAPDLSSSRSKSPIPNFIFPFLQLLLLVLRHSDSAGCALGSSPWFVVVIKYLSSSSPGCLPLTDI